LGVDHPIWGGVSMGGAVPLDGRARARPCACSGVDQRPTLCARRVGPAVVGDASPPGGGPETSTPTSTPTYGCAWVRRAGAARSRPERYGELVDKLRTHSVASLLALLDETYSRSDWIGDCARIRCPVL